MALLTVLQRMTIVARSQAFRYQCQIAPEPWESGQPDLREQIR